MSYLDTELRLYHSQEPASPAKQDPSLGAAGAEEVLCPSMNQKGWTLS